MMNTLSKILLTTLPLAAGGATAAETGEIVIVGKGNASHGPEYSKVNVSVTSICYDSSTGAKNANARLSNRIVDILKSFTADPQDKVTATGGVNVRQTEYIQDGGERKILCERGWRATNTIALSLADFSRIPAVQDQVLQAIDATERDPQIAAQTYAELSRPSFHLTTKTMKKVQKKAQKRAYQNAKSQRQVFETQCDFQNLRLRSITPPEYEVQQRFYAYDAAEGATETPIIPDEISVNATWRFVWIFEPTAGCPAPH